MNFSILFVAAFVLGHCECYPDCESLGNQTSPGKKIFYSYYSLYETDNPNQVLSNLTFPEKILFFDFVGKTMGWLGDTKENHYKEYKKKEATQLVEKLGSMFSKLKIDMCKYKELLDAYNYVVRIHKQYKYMSVAWTKEEEDFLERLSAET